ncbi:putative nuclease HARBI1 [Lampris incognitus]|uniref:putative nuclease HARBI1 n=1 Tax=Lampris incognitus TaxID=2546036 RepID=UPI0024B5405B|nr:putative nuclease HARBI1 [Lampris incognitus]
MDVDEYIQSAGRAVLDMMEREWEPLSQGELEQRLDQAVEDILEADVLAKVRAQPPAVYAQLVQTRAYAEPPFVPTEATGSDPPEEDAAGASESPDTVASTAVNYITDLLQNSKYHSNRTRLAGRARLSLPHTVLLSLMLLSKRISYRSVSTRFRLEKGNIHRIFFSFCERINMLEEEQIRWPVGEEALESLLPFSDLLEGQGLPHVLGVLGDTCIPIRLPIGKQDVESTVPEVKRMKKDAHPDAWLNLELVCDYRGRFLHCRISKGSELDRAGALRDKLKQHPELMPAGSCLVARTGYPLTAHILTPHIVTHGPREDLFNKTLEAHFNIMDQAVANLKARFQRLRYLDMGSYERARVVVLAACILHNVFLDMGQVVSGEAERDEGRMEEEGEGEVDSEGVSRRDAISDLLFNQLDSGSL